MQRTIPLRTSSAGAADGEMARAGAVAAGAEEGAGAAEEEVEEEAEEEEAD